MVLVSAGMGELGEACICTVCGDKCERYDRMAPRAVWVLGHMHE